MDRILELDHERDSQSPLSLKLKADFVPSSRENQTENETKTDFKNKTETGNKLKMRPRTKPSLKPRLFRLRMRLNQI